MCLQGDQPDSDQAQGLTIREFDREEMICYFIQGVDITCLIIWRGFGGDSG
jgi:hypothetical protein